MKRGDKKGLSTVIATMLIILVTIVAVAIVWTVVKSVITKNAELVTLGELTLDLEIVSVTQPEDPVTGDILSTKVKVRRNPGEGNISGLVFTIVDENEESFRFETNEGIEQLEVKLFNLDYNGTILSISVYPIFSTESGKTVTGSVGDTYYEPDYSGAGSGTGDDEDCEPDCVRGIGGYEIECGISENNCGTCSTCASPLICDYGICCLEGYHNYEGVCVKDCSLSDCEVGQECGFPPGNPDCGDDFCGTCTTSGEVCNEWTWTCDACTPDCTGRECGLDPVCHSQCGTDCNQQLGELCTPAGQCEVSVEPVENTGYIDSYWPSPVGRMLFDSDELPTESTVNYYGYSIKFPTNPAMLGQCLTILDFVTPTEGEPYQKSYVKISQFPTSIEVGDYYEIYETYSGCCQGSYC